jgi:hypothetical protein
MGRQGDVDVKADGRRQPVHQANMRVHRHESGANVCFRSSRMLRIDDWFSPTFRDNLLVPSLRAKRNVCIPFAVHTW